MYRVCVLRGIIKAFMRLLTGEVDKCTWRNYQRVMFTTTTNNYAWLFLISIWRHINVLYQGSAISIMTKINTWLLVSNICIRVSHNQGYHLVCTWGQKWKFIYGPKNNWTWRSIDYSVWNQNIVELSLIFIELWHFEEVQYDEKFRRCGCYTMLI